MDAREVLTHLTTPLTAPPYPAVLNNRSRQELFKTGRFIDREYLNIYYRTDPEALRRIVPEPLEIDDPVVRFEVMHMGDVGVSGPYTEAGVAVQVRFGEERGEYLHAMYLDSFSATAGGVGSAGVALGLLTTCSIGRAFSGSGFGFFVGSGVAAAKRFCAAAFSASALRFSATTSSGTFIFAGAGPRAQPVTRPPSTK